MLELHARGREVTYACAHSIFSIQHTPFSCSFSDRCSLRLLPGCGGYVRITISLTVCPSFLLKIYKWLKSSRTRITVPKFPGSYLISVKFSDSFSSTSSLYLSADFAVYVCLALSQVTKFYGSIFNVHRTTE